MGYFYRLTWPAKPEVHSISVTGNFDNWQLSNTGTLVKTADSEHFETFVHVDQKQKLVFKFVVNGLEWTTDESYKIEYDENGNKNNYVDGEELQLEEEPSAKSQEVNAGSIATDKCDFLEPSNEAEETQKQDGFEKDTNSLKETESEDETKYEEVSSDNFLGTHTDEENFSIPETPATPSFPDIYSTVSENFLSEYPGKFSSGEESLSGAHGFSPSNEEIDFKIFRQSSADNGADLENVLIAESSFTEVSYVTSSSQNAFHDLGELSGPEEHFDQPAFPGLNHANSAMTVQEESTRSPNFECLAEIQDSCASSCGDYRSDEDEIDGIGDSIPGDIHGGNFDQTGVFAKIRELFHF